MSFFESLLADLREKRLWPVVAVLVAGMVALPLVISHKVSSPGPGGPHAGPGTSLVTGNVRKLIDASVPTAGAVHVRGALRDPFQLPKAASSSGASGAAGPSKAGPAPAGATGTTGTTNTRGAAPKQLGTVYAITLQFGQAASLKRYTAPIRLATFPDPAAPQVAYLGVRQGAKSALFLVARGAIASGDGHCTPSASDCQIVTMKPGQTEFLDVTSPGVGLVQYELDMGSITKRHTQTRSAAVFVNRIVSEAGLEFARSVGSSEVDKLAFDLVNGVVINTPGGGKGGVVPGHATLHAVSGQAAAPAVALRVRPGR